MQRQLNVRLESELLDFLKRYAKQEYTSISQIVRTLVLRFKREVEKERSEQFDSTKTNSIKTE